MDADLLDGASTSFSIAGRLAVKLAEDVADPYRLLKLPSEVKLTRALKQGRDADSPVSGASAGLSFFLGHMSLLLNRPIPPDILVSATVDEQGNVGGVSGLDHKLALLVHLPGVRRVWVAGVDVRAAEDSLRQLSGLIRRRVEVVGFSHVREVMSVAFQGGAAPPTDPDREAIMLLRFCLGGDRAVPNWGAVAARARIVAGACRSAVRWMADIAAIIALRHTGAQEQADGSRQRWPRMEGIRKLPRALRLRLLAHRIQHATDYEPGQRRSLIRRAVSELPQSGEELSEELRLLGAVGLHLAAHATDERAIRRAVRLLRRAVRGWARLHDDDSVGRPLCALLRLAGISRDVGLIDKLEPLAARCAQPGLHNESTTPHYVRLSMGRARAQSGDPEAALRWLGGMSHPDAPGAVSASCLRWLLYALRLQGRDDPGARAHLLRAAGAHPGEAAFAQALLKLDDALAAGSDVDAALTGCAEHLKVEYERTLRVCRGGDGSDGILKTGRWLAEHSVY